VLLARELGMITIAEGVETAEQLVYLKTMGCDFGQGYLFGKPMDSKAATSLQRTASHRSSTLCGTSH
jgi:EAL domain-containing protein (putative c-di-GMP-specific phosphodiesterase class I)